MSPSPDPPPSLPPPPSYRRLIAPAFAPAAAGPWQQPQPVVGGWQQPQPVGAWQQPQPVVGAWQQPQPAAGGWQHMQPAAGVWQPQPLASGWQQPMAVAGWQQPQAGPWQQPVPSAYAQVPTAPWQQQPTAAVWPAAGLAQPALGMRAAPAYAAPGQAARYGPALSTLAQRIGKDPSECWARHDGSDYRGRVRVTANGAPCLNWLRANASEVLAYGKAGLGDHSFCRHPYGFPCAWCHVQPDARRPTRTFECCDIGEPDPFWCRTDIGRLTAAAGPAGAEPALGAQCARLLGTASLLALVLAALAAAARRRARAPVGRHDANGMLLL